MYARVLAVVLAQVAVLVTGCGGSSSYRLLGKDALEVNASQEVLSRAVSDGSHSLAESVSTEPATVSYPSMTTAVRTWKVEEVTEMARTRTTFTDKGGHLVRIDEIWRRGRPTLLFVECEGGDSLAVINAIVQPLEKAGVRSGNG